VYGLSPGHILHRTHLYPLAEAWKYGQRAFRYCQHDAGHAIGAICIAAAGLGWQTRMIDDLGTDELALLMARYATMTPSLKSRMS